MPGHRHTHLLGIDFGTSNTAAALVGADGKLHTLALDEGSTSMPTALFFSSEDGSVAYGRAAMRAYLEGHEGRLMRSIKSLLGSSLMNEQTLLNGRMVSYFEVVTLFFKELKRRCEDQLGHPLNRAMLGRPVHFVDDETERDALAQETLGRAAREAGFTEIAFQLEPIAAALDYEQRVQHETTALVVDIGGGTSDFTVIQLNPARSAIADRSADILATTGVHIGGTDCDRLLDLATVMPLLGYRHIGTGRRPVPNSVFFDLSTWHLIHQAYTRKALHFAKELWTDYVDQTLHARLMDALEGKHGHRMLSGVEAAKIACSVTGDDALVDLDFLGHGGSEHLGATVTASTMTDTLQQAINQIVQCAQQCVQRSGLASVDTIYLTGGSSALRPLAEALRTAMPGATLVEGNRFSGVAAGLAYAGATLPV